MSLAFEDSPEGDQISLLSRFPAGRTPIVVLSCGIVVAGTALFSALRTPIFEASARVAVRPDPAVAPSEGPGGQSAGRGALTEVEVIRSDGVLDLAAEKLGLQENDDLRRSLRPGLVEGTEVIDIRARRGTSEEAALWANEVARSYVEFRRSSMVDNAAATGGVITRAIQADTGNIARVQERIRANPPDVEPLRAEERRLTARVRNLQTQLLGLTDSEALRKGAATIIDLADPPRKPVQPNWPRDLAIAAGGGLALGGLVSLRLAAPATGRRRFEGASSSLSPEGQEPPRPGSLSADGAPAEIKQLHSRLDKLQNALEVSADDFAGRVSALTASMPSPDSAHLAHRLGRLELKLQENFSAIQGRLQVSVEAGQRLSELENRLEQHFSRLQEVLRSPGDGSPSSATGREIADTLLAQKEAIEALLEAVSAKIAEAPPAEVARLTAMYKQMAVRSEATREEFVSALAKLRNQILERTGNEGLDIEQWTKQWDHLSATRLAKVAAKLDQQLHAIGHELNERLQSQEAHLAKKLDSLDAAGTTISEHLTRVSEQISTGDTRIGATLDSLSAKQEDAAAADAARDARIGATLDSLSAKQEDAAAADAARFEGLLDQFTTWARTQEGTIAAAAGGIKDQILVEVQKDRLQLTERMAELDRDMLERLGKVALRLDRSLAGVREEILGRLGKDGDGGAFATGDDLIKVTEGILAGVAAGKAEQEGRAERLHRDSFDALGKVAIRLNGELQAIRSQISEVISVHQAELADKLDTVTAGLNEEGSVLAARLGNLIGQVSSQVLAQEQVVAAGIDNLKRSILDEVRRDRAQIVERMAEQSHEMLQRFARFASHQG